jgi:hypothetical protein
MGLILTRSPYLVSREGLDNNAQLLVEVGYYDVDDGGLVVQQSYTLSYRNNFYLDIAPLIRSSIRAEYSYWGSAYTGYKYSKESRLEFLCYVRITLSGSINGTAQSDVITEFFATDGYNYIEDRYNYPATEELESKNFYAGSSNVIYKLDDSNIRIPMLQTNQELLNSAVSGGADVNLYKDGELLDTIQFETDKDFSQTYYSLIESDSGYDSYLNRMNRLDAILEDSQCLQDFFDDFKTSDVDKIIIEVEGQNPYIIDVKTISECKYDPYRVTFKNRFGVMEDLWFFKKSIRSISITSERFRSNELPERVSGAGNVRQDREYNKNGKTALTLNSGFVVETLNESFKQLMLSEEVQLYDFKNDIRSSVIIKDSELQFKTSTNDKLINYTIEVEMSNNIIDNIS